MNRLNGLRLMMGLNPPDFFGITNKEQTKPPEPSATSVIARFLIKSSTSLSQIFTISFDIATGGGELQAGLEAPQNLILCPAQSRAPRKTQLSSVTSLHWPTKANNLAPTSSSDGWVGELTGFEKRTYL
jgi:hypothetical protein